MNEKLDYENIKEADNIYIPLRFFVNSKLSAQIKKICNKFSHHSSLYSHILIYFPIFPFLFFTYFLFFVYLKSEMHVPVFSQFSP